MALYYLDAGLTHGEVPGEATLCIYISGCISHCKDCHYQELQCIDYGEPLCNNFKSLIQLYSRLATCVCFMGEGKAGDAERKELVQDVEFIHEFNMKACLYSGRDVAIEEWMKVFDYVKVGSYKLEMGPLCSPTTNQRMYKKVQNEYVDITDQFQD